MKVNELAARAHAELRTLILKHLKRTPMTAAQIAEIADCKASEVRRVIAEMQRASAAITQLADGHYAAGLVGQAGHVVIRTKDRGDGFFGFGVTGDNHLCNKHSRLDVLNALYDEYKREGVSVVFNTANIVDGEHRFNRRELIVRPGMEAQIEYFTEQYPQREGITTYFITGDDHEGWYAQREGINIGDYMQAQAEKAGRSDLIHIGYGESDVEFKGGGGSIPCRVMHPGGGSAYAYSYTTQKIVESFQGGEKPAILLCGHYHKYDSCFPRSVWALQTACTTDQSLFMRKNKIQGHVGGLFCKIRQDKTDGHLAAFEHRFIPFFDRGFYEKRYS